MNSDRRNDPFNFLTITILTGWAALIAAVFPVSIAAAHVISLDGSDWRVATDLDNVGREKKWFNARPPPLAKKTRVPWIIQDAFPGLTRSASARIWGAIPQPSGCFGTC